MKFIPAVKSIIFIQKILPINRNNYLEVLMSFIYRNKAFYCFLSNGTEISMFDMIRIVELYTFLNYCLHLSRTGETRYPQRNSSIFF